MDAAARPARAGIAFVFAVTGAAFGTFAARVPAVQSGLELSDGELGIALAGLMVGAFAGLPAAGPLVARQGSRSVLVAALGVFLGALPLAALVPELITLTVVLFVFGAANSVVDVAMNAQAVDIEHAYGRPILASFHAAFSTGALAAGGCAALVAAAGVSIRVHFAIAAPLLLAAGLLGAGRSVSTRRLGQEGTRLALPTGALMVPGVVMFLVVFAEDVANSWSAVYLDSVAGSGAGLAAAGFAFLAAGVLVGRLVADAIVRWLGGRVVLAASGVLVAAGTALAVAVAEPVPAALALAVVGLGIASVFPVVYSRVGHGDGGADAHAIAAVTTVGYLGSVVGPPSVGALAEVVGLRASFALVALAGLFLAVAAARAK